MKSSFVRKGAAKTADPGTRPGLHGQTLVSMGLVDLDKIFGGGLPLGTILLLLEDLHSQQHLNIIRYFMAEGVACGQRVLWATAGRQQPAAFLPAEASPSQRTKQDDSEKEAEPELKIAWQYRKYIKQAEEEEGAQGSAAASSSSSRSAGGSGSKSAAEQGVGREWCHTFDLTKNMEQDKIDKAGMRHVTCQGSNSISTASSAAAEFIQQFQPPNPPSVSTSPSPAIPVTQRQGPESVGRLVIQSLGGLSWDGGPSECSTEQAVVQALVRLKLSIRDSRCAALVSVPAGMFSHSTLMRLQHLADTVLLLQSLADDADVYKLLPDSASAACLLALPKLCSLGMLAPRPADPTVYVIRHKRKRLAIAPVQVDPDAESRAEEAAQAVLGSLASKGSSSAAKLMCAGPPAAKKSLDF